MLSKHWGKSALELRAVAAPCLCSRQTPSPLGQTLGDAQRFKGIFSLGKNELACH